jgi:hypothetical protein
VEPEQETDGIMGQFIVGRIHGAILTASLGMAAAKYDPTGKAIAARASIPGYDILRERQQPLDGGAIRRDVRAVRRANRHKFLGGVPCQK